MFLRSWIRSSYDDLLNATLSLFQCVRLCNVGECETYEIKLVMQRGVSHAFRAEYIAYKQMGKMVSVVLSKYRWIYS